MKCDGDKKRIKMEFLEKLDNLNNIDNMYNRCIELYTALNYLHTTNEIAHFDIKPDNIMGRIINETETTQTKKPIFIDMGLCETFDTTITNYKSNIISFTLHYTCPCTFNGIKYCEGRDYWALGCTLYEMITGVPFCHYKQEHMNKGPVVKFVVGKLETGLEFLKYLLDLETTYTYNASDEQYRSIRTTFINKLYNNEENTENTEGKLMKKSTERMQFTKHDLIKNIIYDCLSYSIYYMKKYEKGQLGGKLPGKRKKLKPTVKRPYQKGGLTTMKGPQYELNEAQKELDTTQKKLDVKELQEELQEELNEAQTELKELDTTQKKLDVKEQGLEIEKNILRKIRKIRKIINITNAITEEKTGKHVLDNIKLHNNNSSTQTLINVYTEDTTLRKNILEVINDKNYEFEKVKITSQ